MNRPTALLNEDGNIIGVNYLWLVSFNASFEELLLQPAKNFYDENTKGVIISKINQQRSLLIITELSDEIARKKKLRELKKEISTLRSAVIPHEYLRVKKGIINTDFISLCNVIIFPPDNDDLNPDDAGADILQLENYIKEASRLLDPTVNTIFPSKRGLMIIFGLTHTKPNDFYVLAAAKLAFDIIRIIEEFAWRCPRFSSCISISCGSDAKLVLSYDKTSSLDLFGGAFQPLMEMSQYIEPNSILLSKQSMEILSKYNLDCQFLKQNENIYSVVLKSNTLSSNEMTQKYSSQEYFDEVNDYYNNY